MVILSHILDLMFFVLK